MPPIRPRIPVHYDAARRRLWICGQRCHHGATGAVLAAGGAIALAALRTPPLAAVVAAGGALMVHDWHDRSLWFQLGRQDQP